MNYESNEIFVPFADQSTQPLNLKGRCEGIEASRDDLELDIEIVTQGDMKGLRFRSHKVNSARELLSDLAPSLPLDLFAAPPRG